MIQEKNNYCVCAVLQEIFLKNNIVISQEEIANNLTPSEKGFYTDDDKIKKFMNTKGFEYNFYLRNTTPFNEPDMVLKEMENNFGMIGINNHTYFLKNFKDPRLELINPKDEMIIEKNLYQVLNEMRESNGFFGLIKKI